jgi:uncharacterized protein DUF1203
MEKMHLAEYFSEVISMSSFQIVAIPTETADAVRKTEKAPQYGFPAHKEVAAGRAPCRHCLNLIRVNEEKLFLFTYDPFRELGVPPLPGPVYIHADHCERRVGVDSIPEEYRGRALTFAAYGDDRELLSEVRLTAGNEDAEAEKLFTNPAVRYVHVRSTEAGCYLFRLDRK